jgi:hypothetical protein
VTFVDLLAAVIVLVSGFLLVQEWRRERRRAALQRHIDSALDLADGGHVHGWRCACGEAVVLYRPVRTEPWTHGRTQCMPEREAIGGGS